LVAAVRGTSHCAGIGARYTGQGNVTAASGMSCRQQPAKPLALLGVLL
jgi:hypothetical protein